jgi:hypothetical protein
VAVFPANIKHALEGIHLPPVPDNWWYHGPRLLLQPVLVWCALFCAEVIDWPWRRGWPPSPSEFPDAPRDQSLESKGRMLGKIVAGGWLGNRCSIRLSYGTIHAISNT